MFQTGTWQLNTHHLYPFIDYFFREATSIDNGWKLETDVLKNLSFSSLSEAGTASMPPLRSLPWKSTCELFLFDKCRAMEHDGLAASSRGKCPYFSHHPNIDSNSTRTWKWCSKSPTWDVYHSLFSNKNHFVKAFRSTVPPPGCKTTPSGPSGTFVAGPAGSRERMDGVWNLRRPSPSWVWETPWKVVPPKKGP